MVNVEVQKETIFREFDKFARRYDLANRVISFGMDLRWRRKLVSLVARDANLRLLDIASGTGDVAIAAAEKRSNLERIVLLDASAEMLGVAKQKVQRKNLGAEFEFAQADMHELPFADASFDCVSCCFGMRNAVNLRKAVSEITRVLKPGGKALIMEFAVPRNRMFRFIFKRYMKYIVPNIAAIITKRKAAYDYLCETIVNFETPTQIIEMLEKSGFGVNCIKLLPGCVWIYEAEKER